MVEPRRVQSDKWREETYVEFSLQPCTTYYHFVYVFQAAEEVDPRIREMCAMATELVNTTFEDAWERSANEVSMTIMQSVTHARAHMCS